MNVRRWGIAGALLAAASLSGCEKSPAEKVQDERADVIEAQQNVRQEKAELSQAKAEERADEAAPGADGGPLLPPIPTPDSAPTEGSPNTSPPADGAKAELTDAPAATGQVPAASQSQDAPNEGAPEAGTPAEGTGDRPATAPPLNPKSGSDGQ